MGIRSSINELQISRLILHILGIFRVGPVFNGSLTPAYSDLKIALPYLTFTPAIPPHVSNNTVSCLLTVIFNEFKKHKAISSSFIV
jgi:hypothetical protein